MSVSRDLPVLLVLVLTDLWILWDTVSLYPAVCIGQGTPCTLTAGQHAVIAFASVALALLVVQLVRTLFDSG